MCCWIDRDLLKQQTILAHAHTDASIANVMLKGAYSSLRHLQKKSIPGELVSARQDRNAISLRESRQPGRFSVIIGPGNQKGPAHRIVSKLMPIGGEPVRLDQKSPFILLIVRREIGIPVGKGILRDSSRVVAAGKVVIGLKIQHSMLINCPLRQV